MHKYNYQEGLDVGRVCFEMSLKPFIYLDDEYIEKVCRELFTQWKPLTDKASSVAVMLWTADGSEILEYDGDLSKTFNWCNLIGIGNPRKEPQNDVDFVNLHIRPVPYNEHMHDFTYGDLKRVVSAIKRVGKEMTGFDICVVETFDPGPEFAKSDFKFNRHTELAVGHTMGNNQWIYCAGKLHAEDRKYAAFPNGIPEGTPFGTFLGKQFMALKNDIGFDRLWLSNGFGFSLQSWNCCGEVFDGEKFDFDGVAVVNDRIAEFWRTFSAEVGDMVIEARGSNLSAAMDISAHGCPVDEIYKYNMIAPPNSPWAALDSRFGLELCGYLSRIAALPENRYLFRYYIHDPWWANSPWFDRYGKHPHDIYLPLSMARLDGEGRVTKPMGINLLSVDDSFGQMPEKCPNEVIPHILNAMNDYPEYCGPVTWLYPFETYCEIGLRKGEPHRIFMDDWFIESAIELGFPISSVISDKSFMTADTAKFKDTILVTPVPDEGSLHEKCLLKALDGGIKVLLYGSTAHASEKLRSMIGVELAEPAKGEFMIDESLTLDTYEKNDLSRKLAHPSLVSNGGLCEIAKNGADIRASVRNEKGEVRAYSSFSGNIAWVRGSFPHNTVIRSKLPEQLSRTKFFPPAVLLRSALSLFGLKIGFSTYSAEDDLPIIILSDGKDSMFMTSYAKDMNVRTRISTPLGAPVCTGCDAIVENDTAEMLSPKWQHEELRLFIKQKERSHVKVKYETIGDNLKYDKRVVAEGLKDATVYLRLPEPFAYAECALNSGWPWFTNSKEMKYTEDGRFAYVKNVTGKLDLAFQTRDTREEYIKLGYLKK